MISTLTMNSVNGTCTLLKRQAMDEYTKIKRAIMSPHHHPYPWMFSLVKLKYTEKDDVKQISFVLLFFHGGYVEVSMMAGSRSQLDADYELLKSREVSAQKKGS